MTNDTSQVEEDTGPDQGTNGGLTEVGATPDFFTWHGAELLFIPLMMAVGVLGNALVLYITHCRWKSQIFNFFIKVLAWLDMSNLLLTLPMYLVMVATPDHDHYMELCRSLTFFALFTAVASALVLVVIAANRFRKLCQPHKSQMKLWLAKALTVVSLAVGVAISVPSVFLFGKETAAYNAGVRSVNISYCFIQHDVSVAVLLGWAVTVGAVFSAVTASLVLLYTHTIRALRQHDRNQRASVRRPSTTSTNSSRRVSAKHTWVFIAVTVVFFLTYSPYLLTVVLLIADRTIESRMNHVTKALFDLAKLFPLLSNISNPIIYSFTSDNFRSECRKIFKLRPCFRALDIRRKDSVTTQQSQSES